MKPWFITEIDKLNVHGVEEVYIFDLFLRRGDIGVNIYWDYGSSSDNAFILVFDKGEFLFERVLTCEIIQEYGL